MLPTRYIEVDSTYRNRNQFPKPADFDILISQSGQKSKLTALDPVCNSAPILTFNSSFTENANAIYIDAISVTLPTTTITSPSDPSTLLISTANELRKVKDFYVGSIIQLTISSVVYYRRIISYEFLNTTGGGNSTAIIQVNSPFPSIAGAGSGIITNPTPANTSNPLITGGAVKFYIPTGSFINNFYVNYYIQNLDTTPTEYKKIIAYDGETRLATLESATDTNWLASYNFAVRKEIPFTGTATAIANSITSITSITSSSTGLSQSTDAYVGDYIRFSNNSSLTPTGISVSPYGEQRRITAYTYSAGTATISFYPPVTLIHPTPPPTSTTYNFEIEPFTRDNWSPFNYTGSMVSSQQLICYEVELVNLILPNLLLKSGRGGRTAFYPYLYVEFYPLSDVATNTKGILYSNNPNAYRMLFRAIVDDVQQPLISSFVKIGGDGTVHTMKFKPNDSFHFAVYNSDGELFETVIQDNVSPVAPNPLIQISALFSFKRV